MNILIKNIQLTNYIKIKVPQLLNAARPLETHK